VVLLLGLVLPQEQPLGLLQAQHWARVLQLALLAGAQGLLHAVLVLLVLELVCCGKSGV
jgi:hypothetical protein